MNIFRELVDELKEENLLEHTVIEPGQDKSQPVENEKQDTERIEDGGQHATSDEVAEEDRDAEDSAALDSSVSKQPIQMPEDGLELTEPVSSEPEYLAPEFVSEFEEQDDSDVSVDASPGLSTPIVDSKSKDEADAEAEAETRDPETARTEKTSKSEKIRNPQEEKKFYRQRAMDEVTGLQLVEHVLSGVEREQMKSAPKTFDDLAVKRSLHDFLKVADDLNSPETSKAEFQLLQETENWCSALSRRDRNISVAHLRRYCETTKPRLSSQALISLARFYRNSPYSEAVRSKFDLVFTKLFSKDQGGDLRSVVFKNEELIKHVQELYADWSSIPLYSTDEDDSELLLTALKFDDFIKEAESAKSFDELVKTDFFKRLKLFKASTNENFFAPVVVAAGIESNVKVGNRYVELIELERHRSAGTEIGDKYGVTYDNYISDATSKTLELIDMLRSKKPQPTAIPKPPIVKPEPILPEPNVALDIEPDPKRFTVVGGANKWLIVATVVVLIVTAWLFLQGSIDITNQPQKGTISANELSLAGTPLGEYIHSARVSRNTMFGITVGSWDQLTVEKKKQIVKEAVGIGKSNDFDKVHLLNSEGKSVAYGSMSKVSVY